MTDETAPNPLSIDSDKFYDAELGSYVPDANAAFIFVTLPDETEERFRISERLLHRAGYYNNTPVKTKLRVKLAPSANGLAVIMIEKNPPQNIPPRPDARNLPWLKAKLVKPTKPNLDHVFLTVTDANEYFRLPTEVYVAKRLLEKSGYPDGLQQDQEIDVRMIQGERGLTIIQVRYAPDAKNPSHDTDS